MKTSITVHASLSPPSKLVTLETLELRDRRFGLRGCGYHRVIERTGAARIGRSLTASSPHDREELAKTSVSVCLVGGLSEAQEPVNDFTPEQLRSLTSTVEEIEKTLGITANVESACPCLTTDDLRSWLGRLHV